MDITGLRRCSAQEAVSAQGRRRACADTTAQRRGAGLRKGLRKGLREGMREGMPKERGPPSRHIVGWSCLARSLAAHAGPGTGQLVEWDCVGY